MADLGIARISNNDMDAGGTLTRAELLTIRANIAPDFERRRKGRR